MARQKIAADDIEKLNFIVAVVHGRWKIEAMDQAHRSSMYGTLPFTFGFLAGMVLIGIMSQLGRWTNMGLLIIVLAVVHIGAVHFFHLRYKRMAREISAETTDLALAEIAYLKLNDEEHLLLQRIAYAASRTIKGELGARKTLHGFLEEASHDPVLAGLDFIKKLRVSLTINAI